MDSDNNMVLVGECVNGGGKGHRRINGNEKKKRKKKK